MSFRKILVPTDFSQHADQAVRVAKRLARAFDGELRLVHVSPSLQAFAAAPLAFSVPVEVAEGWSSKARGLLETAVQELSADGINASEELIDDGSSIAEAVCGLVETWEADVVVMGTHGYSGFERGILGSVAEKLVAASLAPVLSVKVGKGWDSTPQRILVPTDLSAESRNAVALAGQLAQAFQAEIELLHVFETVPPAFLDIPIPDLDREAVREEAREALADELKALEERGVSATLQFTTGNPGKEIVAQSEARESNLVVMGTHGRTRFRRFLVGSVAARVVRFADCPVMTCGAKG